MDGIITTAQPVGAVEGFGGIITERMLIDLHKNATIFRDAMFMNTY